MRSSSAHLSASPAMLSQHLEDLFPWPSDLLGASERIFLHQLSLQLSGGEGVKE